MGCEQYQAQFTDFLEATLPEAEWRELEAHLRACPACAADIKQFRQTVSALRGLEVMEPPRQLLRAISAQVASAAASPKPVTVALRPPRRSFSWRVAGTLAGACAALVAVIMVARPGLQPPPVALPAAGGPVATLPPAASAPAAAIPAPAATAPALSAPATSAPAAALRPTPRPATRATASRGARPTVRRLPFAPQPGAPTAAPPVVAEAATTGAGPAGSAGPETAKFGGVPLPSMEGAGSADRSRPAAPGAVVFGAMATPSAVRAVGVDIKVTPPSERVVDTWGTVRISLIPEGAVPQASVRVIGSESLEVRQAQVYSGPLAAQTAKQVTAQVRAKSAGDHALRVVVRSDTPVVNTDLPVRITGYREAPSPGQTRRAFSSVRLADAVAQVAGDGGLRVWVTPELAERRVSADFSEGVSVAAALRLLATMADGRLERANGEYRLVAAR